MKKARRTRGILAALAVAALPLAARADPVTLKFGGGETVKADFPVEGASGTMPMGKMNMGK